MIESIRALIEECNNKGIKIKRLVIGDFTAQLIASEITDMMGKVDAVPFQNKKSIYKLFGVETVITLKFRIGFYIEEEPR